MNRDFVGAATSPLRMSNNLGSKPTTVRLGQVGWLGQTGAIYGLNAPHDKIKLTEPGGYAPLYIKLDD